MPLDPRLRGDDEQLPLDSRLYGEDEHFTDLGSDNQLRLIRHRRKMPRTGLQKRIDRDAFVAAVGRDIDV